MKKKKLKIEFNEYEYPSDENGNEHIYGLSIKINNTELPFHNMDVETVVEQILQHLGYKYEITYTYNGEILIYKNNDKV